MEIPRFTERVAKEHKCSPELVVAIVSDCLAALHETGFKQGMGSALIAAYWELGPLAAWHFSGILSVAAKDDPGELVEHYRRLDPSMVRFRSLLDQWETELKRDCGAPV